MSTQNEIDTTTGKNTYERIIKECPTAMLSSHDEIGKIVSRPMHTILDTDDNSTVWIFTKYENNICEQVRKNDVVCLSYSDPARNSYMSLVGTALLVNDRAMMKKYWSPIMKVWYPEGLDDPSMIFIKITPLTADFWDGPSSKVVTLFAIAAAIIQGKEYDGGEDSLGKVSF